jgi:hypothetical protein
MRALQTAVPELEEKQQEEELLQQAQALEILRQQSSQEPEVDDQASAVPAPPDQQPSIDGSDATEDRHEDEGTERSTSECPLSGVGAWAEGAGAYHAMMIVF